MRIWRYLALLAVVIVLLMTIEPVRTYGQFMLTKLVGSYTVADRLEQYADKVSSQLNAAFSQQGISYPPKHLAVLAFKDTNMLQLYAKNSELQNWQLVKTYPIVKASGVLGPKLQEGDKQVPEGIYQSESLNPNSRYHLAIRVNYPNDFDRQMAQLDGRINLGGDIMIHGSSSSVGCLAMGNDAAEELFVLAALSANNPLKIIISPTDFRTNAVDELAVAGNTPRWRAELYQHIRQELTAFPSAN
jgi:murein L,D-transpeptidase YafK